MPWSDLSAVTAALTRLLKLYIEQVISPGLVVNAVSTPPDQLGNSVSNTLSLYLYHVRESAQTQNLPGSEVPGIATASMGLELFYVLTAHQRSGTSFDATIEQRLMGFALKSLHDVPVLTDATEILGQPVITGTERGRGNRLNVELRKLDPEQAFAIWTTGERQFTRLAAYYRVGLVLLDPQPPQRVPGVVLSLGAFVTPHGAPQLGASFSDMAFTLPAPAGGGAQVVRAQPARPFLMPGISSDATLTILGDGLGAGPGRRLVLRNARWQGLAQPVDRVPLDPERAANRLAGWLLAFQPARIGLRLGARVEFVPEGGGAARTLALLPGTYLIQLELDVGAPARPGLPSPMRPLRVSSNVIAVALCPRIRTHAILATPDTLRIDLEPAFTLLPPAPQPPLEIELALDGQVYRRADPGPPAAGEFSVAANALTVATLFDTGAAGLHTVRLSVEGAEAQPYWISTP